MTVPYEDRSGRAGLVTCANGADGVQTTRGLAMGVRCGRTHSPTFKQEQRCATAAIRSACDAEP